MPKLTGANSLVAHMTPGFEPWSVTAEGAGILIVACLQGMFIDTFYHAYQMHLLYYRYFQQVLNETVRTAKLTPIAARLQENEGKVDQHIIPKETLVIYALGVVLQDADTWSRPYKFDPDRFTEDSARKSFSLLGFSGNQACPELRFAYTVATVVLSTVVRQLKLHQVKGQVVEVRSELVSTPKDDTWITVSRRS